MNRKGNGYIIVAIIIIAIVLIIIGTIKLSVYSNDQLQKANCKALGNNGYDTHLETIRMYGFNWLDCYVETIPGKYVPYDRFRGIE